MSLHLQVWYETDQLQPEPPSTQVTDAQCGGPGGGLAEKRELTEVVHLTLNGTQAFVEDLDVPKTLGIVSGISSFLSDGAPEVYN